MKATGAVLVLFIIGLLAAGPGAWAQEAVPGETVPEGPWEQRRWVVEGYGGLARAAGGDLDTLRGYDEGVQQHMFDSQLDALQRSGQIASWEKEQSGDRSTIEASWSLGLRVKRRQSRSLAFSLGFQYLGAGGSNDVSSVYTRQEHDGNRRIEELSYSPYTLSVTAWAPLVGIHYGRPLGRKLTFEGFLVGGPLFADFDYVSDWSYAFSMQGPDMNGLLFETAGGLDGGGQGTGVAAELGLRLGYGLADRLALFAEVGYAYQKVTSPSGPGSQLRRGERVEWDGEWAIGEDRITAPWGDLELERPTNEWPEGSSDGRLGDFDLDLSGLRFTFGFSFGL
jgi:hypothetical protein